MAYMLDRERWVSYLTSPKGTTYKRLKRVSAKANEQFPLLYRKSLLDDGPIPTVKLIMKTKGLGIADAWTELRNMCNKPC